MKKVSGDLINKAKEGAFDCIVHGCNCFCTMGAGIAKVIKATWPEAYKADLNTEKGDKSKLGTISSAIIIAGSHSLIVVNAYTQFNYRGRGLKVDYDAIRSCFKHVYTKYGDLKIGYPLIGAGLAGGNWSIIEKIIDEELAGADHTLVQFSPN